MSVTMRVTCHPESAMGGVFVRDRVGRVEDGRTFEGAMLFRFEGRGEAAAAAERVRTLTIAGLDVAISEDPRSPSSPGPGATPSARPAARRTTTTPTRSTTTMPATAGSNGCATGGSSSCRVGRALRVSDILFACDPLGVARYGSVGEYDRHAAAIAAIDDRGRLHAYLGAHGLASLSAARSLEHFLGLDPPLDELYPPLPHETPRG